MVPAALDAGAPVLDLQAVPERDRRVFDEQAALTSWHPVHRSPFLRTDGDYEDWRKRQAASARLASYGPAAAPNLRAAASNPDAEIALRVEQLLAAQQPGRR